MSRPSLPQHQALYDELLRAAQCAESYLFVQWINWDGTRELYARTGGAHRGEFWRGMDALVSLAPPGSDGAVAYAAGRNARNSGLQPACSAGRLDPSTGRVRVRPA